MNEVWLLGLVAFCIFGAAYYQSFRDSRRWKRIVSGRSMDADREEFPLLMVDGQGFEANQRRVMVIWGDLTHSGFHTTSDARKEIEEAVKSENPRSDNARIFVWDGGIWMQR
jgi:hypothetical protein